MDETAVASVFFFFNDTATTEIYTLSLHDALPISTARTRCSSRGRDPRARAAACARSEEHTSELQSRLHLVCRLLLEKKKTRTSPPGTIAPQHRSPLTTACADHRC